MEKRWLKILMVSSLVLNPIVAMAISPPAIIVPPQGSVGGSNLGFTTPTPSYLQPFPQFSFVPTYGTNGSLGGAPIVAGAAQYSFGSNGQIGLNGRPNTGGTGFLGGRPISGFTGSPGFTGVPGTMLGNSSPFLSQQFFAGLRGLNGAPLVAGPARFQNAGFNPNMMFQSPFYRPNPFYQQPNYQRINAAPLIALLGGLAAKFLLGNGSLFGSNPTPAPITQQRPPPLQDSRPDYTDDGDCEECNRSQHNPRAPEPITAPPPAAADARPEVDPDHDTEAGSPALPPSTDPIPVAEACKSGSAQQKELCDLVNKERAAKGLAALIMNPELNKFAQKYADALSKTNPFPANPHDHPTLGDFNKRADGSGIKTIYIAAENIAGGGDAKTAIQGWKSSADHSKNLFNRNYKYHGIGSAEATIKDSSGQMQKMRFWIHVFGQDAKTPVPVGLQIQSGPSKNLGNV
ncbi:MAG: CAP domain-containing protein [Bdellovibrionales bacterium]